MAKYRVNLSSLGADGYKSADKMLQAKGFAALPDPIPADGIVEIEAQDDVETPNVTALNNIVSTLGIGSPVKV